MPWSNLDDWNQMKLSLEMTFDSQREWLHAAKELSDQIAAKTHSIDTFLDTLCKKTCVNCHDICCGRATLWFDFRDLLFIYFNTCEFPKQQIFKNIDLSCCYLGPFGCQFKRCERPFICTWYICPKQTSIMGSNGFRQNGEYITSILKEIKLDRKSLEQMFLEVAC